VTKKVTAPRLAMIMVTTASRSVGQRYVARIRWDGPRKNHTYVDNGAETYDG